MNHILVVDDEAEIRTSLEEILREEGYGVASAATAAEAMVLIRTRPMTWCCSTSGCPTAMGSTSSATSTSGRGDAARGRDYQRPRHH